MKVRRTQAERREATQAQLLAAARRIFGEKGYAETSLEEIAAACDMTIRPVYHYFENKLGLFEAVTEQIEAEIVGNIENRKDARPEDIWTGFMRNCEDPHFRQIILIDGPTLLGRRRVNEGPITLAVRENAADMFGARPDGLTMSLLMGALSQAALYIAEHGAKPSDYAKIRDLIEFHSGRYRQTGGHDDA